jgi:diguanylate cyclase (GGDEF)-like protein
MKKGAIGSKKRLVRLHRFERFPKGGPVALGVSLVAAISAIDWITGPQLNLSPLYVLAVMAVVATGTRRDGLLIAVLGAVSGMAADFVGLGLGAIHWVPMWNGLARLIVLAVVATLIGSLRESLADQRRQALVDPLTGAYNRRAFQIVAERERLRSGRDGTPLSLAYFDIDGFKQFNDSLGHAAGDDMLQTFAGALASGIRGTDLLARLGGDEFVLLLPDTDAKEAVGVINRLRAAIAEVSANAPITASVGIATHRFPPPTVDALISSADELMYKAKEKGGDQVVGSIVSGPWTRWSDHVNLTHPAEATRVF